MNYDQLIAYKPQLMSLFSAYKVENPRVFGWASEVDFLVTWSGKHSLFDRIRLKQKLESLLQHKVELLTNQSLYPGICNELLEITKPL